MGTRSKKISKFFPKAVRVTAFITACVAAGIALFGEMDVSRIKDRIFEMGGDMRGNLEYPEIYRTELKNMYEQLCILGVCELANMDENGKYIGNKNVQSDLLYYFDFNEYRYKKTGEGIVPYSDIFDYYVSYTVPEKMADEVLTDDETTAEEERAERTVTHFVTNISEDIINDKMTEQERINALTSNKYGYILRSGDVISSSMVSSGVMDNYSYQVAEKNGKLRDVNESYPDNYLPMGGWYSDNYGRHVFSFCNDSPIKFYEYPENTEEGFTARREWVDIESNTAEGSGIYYSTLPICDMPDYKATSGDTEGLTVYIEPEDYYFHSIYREYEDLFSEYLETRSLSLQCGILALLLIVYLIAGAVVRGLAGEHESSFADKLPFELYIGAWLLILMGTAVMGHMYWGMVYSADERAGDSAYWYLTYGAIFAVMTGIAVHSIIHVIKLISQGRCRRSFALPKLMKKLSERYRTTSLYETRRNRPAGSGLMRRSVRSLVAFLAATLMLPSSLYGSKDALQIAAAVVCVAASVYFIYSQIRAILLARDLTKLDRRITELNRNTPFEVEISPLSELSRPSDMLKNISDTVSDAVEEQIKSERMKIELVANVSHDLKTPLTSIISYIDLLKKTELDDEAMGYVQILDKKSQKLKSIVADVFSLAKATSGIDVNMEELDFVRLFNQCLADADDKINESGKVVKLSVTADTAPVMGDGNKLYRVLQNIIDNALKYSMDGSRIFMELKRTEDDVVLSVKNTSSYPIEFTADEITERFVRGDKSRTDGGSGLGLSIAKSFTEACGGHFDIELEGDMFKAVMTMPLIKKEQAEEKEII
ncbi:sensor histidine kinase [Ruminococcus albus]|uniref:sensor histidine kinase n=1 Tax=Ruminococcus albus TaxID=1264 RepID=UPI00067FC030|nr:HAMP domain-containing sensor histidine kinase [Ruminococcus albus]